MKTNKIWAMLLPLLMNLYMLGPLENSGDGFESKESDNKMKLKQERERAEILREDEELVTFIKMFVCR